MRGVIAINGAKNAALPALAATLLTADECTLNNVPDLADIETMADLLRALGAVADQGDENVEAPLKELGHARLGADDLHLGLHPEILGHVAAEIDLVANHVAARGVEIPERLERIQNAADDGPPVPDVVKSLGLGADRRGHEAEASGGNGAQGCSHGDPPWIMRVIDCGSC